MHQSFREYVNLVRYHEACKMMMTGQYKMLDICMECGFSDYRYLNKIYQKQLGYTPMEYRSSHEISVLRDRKEEDVINTQTFCSTEDSLEILKIAEERYGR